MLYREAGQFKTTYSADMAIFPIRQDRIALAALLVFVFVGVPLLAKFQIWPLGSDYMLRAILIPFLILSLAAIGVNILIGYCGQISLGSGAFMARPPAARTHNPRPRPSGSGAAGAGRLPPSGAGARW